MYGESAVGRRHVMLVTIMAVVCNEIAIFIFFPDELLAG